MKTRNQMKPLARLIAASLAVGSMAGFGAQAFAQTAAGTLIKNLATVTYEDENGNSYSAQSNEAVVTVAPVYSATIENDNNLSGAPGQTVYFPHTLTNTGNIADSFTLAADNGGVVYVDSNNNGQPDPGESIVTGPVNVPAGDQVSLVVALAVPTSAVGGTTLSTELTATSANTTVTDSGANSDSLDGTNDDTVTVATGPVLVLNKSSVHDVANNQITYTLTVKNNGSSDASNVNIVDALPEVDTDGDGVADTQVTLVAGSITSNGLVNTGLGDITPTSTIVVNETTNPLGDVNLDGDSLDVSVDAIQAKDVTLPANTTVSVTYTVQYMPTWNAGSSVENTFMSFDDPNDDGDPTDATAGPVPSNTTNDVIPQTYGVDALDTATGLGLGVNDGGDDGATADDQYVDVVATGAEVLFQHVITNNGNGDDTFNVNVANNATDGFPAGTVFTYWDSTGTVQLTDTDNDGFPDTGMLASGASETIMVKADLPAGISGNPGGDYNATLTATSSADPSSTPQSDTTGLRLGAITPPGVDIANVTAGQGSAFADGFNDGNAENAQDEAPVVLASAAVNSTVTFDLHLANESGSADSFLLGTGNVPAGWSVVFKDASGNVITTTPLVPGNGVFAYTAEVTISADPAEALANSDQVGAVDGYDAANDGTTAYTGTDSDLDYQLDFTATSTSTPGVADSVTNAVDIDDVREVVITPNGQNQVQPGGTVDYSHKLENNGNQTEVVEMTPSNTQPGWTTVINVDTTGDGVPDSVLNAPPSGTTVIIKGVDDNGNIVDIEVTDADGDGIPELNLEPGENVNMTTTVTAPSNAPLGTVDSSTVSVTEAGGTPITSASDQTTVLLGQVRLDKTAAIDLGCDGTLDSGFLATQTMQAAPDDCIVWNLTATNEGTATVKNVVISDAAPAFTDYVLESMMFCHGNGCTVSTVNDASNTDNGTYTAGLIKFFANNGASDPAAGIGGELVAGEQMTGQFTVKVQ
ncbi:MAG: hypothetical protein ACPG47_00640 [Leucothrix sp.]